MKKKRRQNPMKPNALPTPTQEGGKSETDGNSLWGEWLTREEATQLLRQFRPDGQTHSFTTEEAGLLWGWAETTRFQYSILELALDGHVEISIQGGDLAFSAIGKPLDQGDERPKLQ